MCAFHDDVPMRWVLFCSFFSIRVHVGVRPFTVLFQSRHGYCMDAPLHLLANMHMHL